MFYGNAMMDDVKPFIAGGVAGMISWYVTREAALKLTLRKLTTI